MKKLFLLPLAALALAACSDNPAAVPLGEPGTPLFDDIVSDIPTDVVSGTRTMSLVTGGTGQTTLSVTPTGQGNRPEDGKSGCNFTGSSPKLVVSVNSSDGSTAMVTPTSLEFTSCGDQKTLTVIGLAAGSAEITLSQVSNNTGGTFDFSKAKFTVVVSQPAPTDNTPPSIEADISGTMGDNGWYTSNVSVGWTVQDGDSDITSMSGCGTTTITEDTDGVTLTCTATSAGGTSTESVTIKRDATAPTISGSRSPAANANGWNNTDVAVSFTCSDNLSGVASCGPEQTVSSEGANQSVTGTARDEAGNTATATVGGINIDKTAPIATANASPAANNYGWNNTNVTVGFTGIDGLSGIDSCSDAVVLSDEGANQSASGTCTDKAGNVSVAVAKSVSIDKTAPIVSLVGGPANGGTYYFGDVPAAPTCEASDALSELDGACSVSGHGTAVGAHKVKATATDKAGNVGRSAEVEYTVLAWDLRGFYRPVVMGKDVVNTVKAGSTVPLKFEVFAGSTEITLTSAVASFKQTVVSCDTGAMEDAVDVTTTGGTSLRYDATEGQFIQNWQTPKKPGACYKVTMTTQDSSSIDAYFKLK